MLVQHARSRLRLRFADGSSIAVALHDGVNTVGRSPLTNVRLHEDRFASPVHALLMVNGDEVSVREARSLNGLFLRIGRQPIRLQHGDELLIGSTIVRLDIDGRKEVGEDGG